MPRSMVASIWFCISCKSCRSTDTVLPLRQSRPRLESTMTSAEVAFGGGGPFMRRTSPSAMVDSLAADFIGDGLLDFRRHGRGLILVDVAGRHTGGHSLLVSGFQRGGDHVIR